jgi:hypothetical protein
VAVCEHCGRTLVCPGTGAALEHPAESHRSTASPVLPCSPKAALWVRVRAAGKGLPGVKVEAVEKSVATDDAGFVGFENVDPSTSGHTVRISLSDELDKHYMLPAQASIKQPVKAGQISLVPFEVAERVRPVIEMARDHVAVKGARLAIGLRANGAFSGKGVLTCTGGDGKVRFFTKKGDALDMPAATFDGITDAGVDIEAEALAASDLGGIELRWELDGGATRAAPAATKKITAVEAVLDLYKKSGDKLDPGEKSGAGLVLHVQNDKKERRRARVTVTCKPAAFRGAVQLAAIKPGLALYTKGGDPIDISEAVDITSDDPLDLLLEGTAVSAAAGDTGLTLRIKDLSTADPVDSAKVTVIETRIDVHQPRPPKPPPAPRSPPPPPSTAREDPPVVPGGEKLDPGRTLFLQSAGFAIQRAMVRVVKRPHDAPCKLVVRSPSTGNELSLFPDAGTRAHTHPTTKVVSNVPHSFENHTDGEAAGVASMDIAHDAIKDAAAGLCYWVEGAKSSRGGKVRLQIDVDGVDEACDAVSFTVAEPTLTVKVAQADKKTLFAGDVDFEVKLRSTGVRAHAGTVATTGKAAAEATVPLPAGEYVVTLAPKNGAEAAMRVNRTEPATQDAAIPVKGLATAAYELAPKYDKIQLVGYYIRTGLYEGSDDPATITSGSPKEKMDKALWQDLEARCGFMADAIDKAATAKGVLASDPTVLKIFMAPEFYFRGKQGAYPLDMVSEILNVKSLKDALAKDAYKDWLFVLGSAIGTIDLETQAQRKTFAGTITAVAPSYGVKVKCAKTSAQAKVAKDWFFWYRDKKPDGPLRWLKILGATDEKNKSKTETFFFLEVDGFPRFREKVQMGVTKTFPMQQVALRGKRIDLAVTSTTPPQVGWELEQLAVKAQILNVWPGSDPDEYQLLVAVANADKLDPAAATLVDGLNRHAVTVDEVLGGRVILEHGPSSPAAAADGTWSFCMTASSSWVPSPETFKILSVKTLAPRRLQVELDVVPVIPGPMAFGLMPPLGGDVTPVLTQKLTWLDVDVPSGTIQANQYLEQGAEARALVGGSSLTSGTTHDVRAWIPGHRAELTAGPLTFVDRGEVEILNVALVCKGGKAAPLRGDGGAGRELLIYKENISSVDFQGLDYGTQAFYAPGRHSGEVGGDQSRQLLHTEGAGDGSSPNVPGATEFTDSSGKKHTVPRITEHSGSGLGGGSIFTMDDITFGLEVCLDHGQGKLLDYYDNHAQAGERRVQVQLIPSCGMSIAKRCCVADGIIFNVDAKHYAAEKDGGGTPVEVTPALVPITPTPPDIATHFDVTTDAGQGTLLVYTALKTPTKAVV